MIPPFQFQFSRTSLSHALPGRSPVGFSRTSLSLSVRKIRTIVDQKSVICTSSSGVLVQKCKFLYKNFKNLGLFPSPGLGLADSGWANAQKARRNPNPGSEEAAPGQK